MLPHRDYVRYIGIQRVVTRYCNGPFQDAAVASYRRCRSRKLVARRMKAEAREVMAWVRWATRRTLPPAPPEKPHATP